MGEKGELYMSRLASFLVASAVAFVCVASSQAASDRAVLRGSAPPWANSHNLVGSASPGEAVGFRVYLGWRDAAGAEAFARSVSRPGRSAYRQYLTPARSEEHTSELQSPDHLVCR